MSPAFEVSILDMHWVHQRKPRRKKARKRIETRWSKKRKEKKNRERKITEYQIRENDQDISEAEGGLDWNISIDVLSKAQGES